MKLPNQIRPRFPVEDYRRANHSAVSWLGDRYLLAAPINMRPDSLPRWRFYTEGRPGWRERISERQEAYGDCDRQ